jgi:hypothetical protein
MVLPRPGWRRIDKLAAAVGEDEWRLIEAGPSRSGSRWWQWHIRRIADPDEPLGAAEQGQIWYCRWMIARRRPQAPGDMDYYLAWGPASTPPEHLAHVAGARWRVEDAIKLSKHQCGLADYEVRHWHGWYRHITLSMLAAAFLAVQAASSSDQAQEEPKRGSAKTSAVPGRSSPAPRPRSASSSYSSTHPLHPKTARSPTDCAGHAGAATTRPWPANTTGNATPSSWH